MKIILAVRDQVMVIQRAYRAYAARWLLIHARKDFSVRKVQRIWRKIFHRRRVKGQVAMR